jgi:Leucine-rich repeat (LRR) protein
MVQAIGLELTAPVDSNGHFSIRVPAGWCRINILGLGPNLPVFDTMVFLQPGQRMVWAPPVGPLPCDSLACDIAVVREILYANGLPGLAAESVIVVANNHVTELRLGGRNLHVLPATVGHLMRLTVLDISYNFVDSLPQEIGHLHKVKVLRADHNTLWLVPATIGMLDSLDLLDLSYNRLQSLPEPITYLRPTAGLYLGGNMLCNIGDFTAQWADLYSLGWKEQQICQ